MKRSKFNNTKVVNSFGSFDSQKEFERFLSLREDQRLGLIKNLNRQVVYKLTDDIVGNRVKITGEKYKADFVYEKGGNVIVEDVKGFKTAAYKRKKRIMKAVYNIDILET